MEAMIPAKDAAARVGAARPAPTQIVVRDLPDIGKYKVRLVQKSARDARLILDIREYANGPNYQGFTRRGIRLLVQDELPKLREAIEAVTAGPAGGGT